MSRIGRVVSGGSTAGARRPAPGFRRDAPHFLDVVELPDFGAEQMYDHVAGVDQDPVSLAQTLGLQPDESPVFQTMQQTFRERCDLPARSAGRDDHVVGDRRLASEIDIRDIDCLEILQTRQNDVDQGRGVGVGRFFRRYGALLSGRCRAASGPRFVAANAGPGSCPKRRPFAESRRIRVWEKFRAGGPISTNLWTLSAFNLTLWNARAAFLRPRSKNRGRSAKPQWARKGAFLSRTRLRPGRAATGTSPERQG